MNVEPTGGTTGTGLAGDTVTAAYLLGLADDAMVYAQRLGEWLTHAPQIEEDMALANISLDLLGQARALYPRVGELDGTGRGEDDYAMMRDERSWRNVLLVEQPRGDFADEMARLLWFSAARLQLLVAGSGDPVLDGVMGKGAKEVSYHLDHAAQWVVRLGDGTDESHRRMQVALERVAPYVEELFEDDPVSLAVASEVRGLLPSETRTHAVPTVEEVLARAGLTLPEPGSWRSRGGREGIHSRPMGSLLAEMQYLARSHPGASW
ncbi:MAG: phenylacetate-CoA oxygenase subunit PaaC [Actinomycetota bacterium]|nr:phenylacetate-CoA oxygenase subunit PaaC [Actinomycetota bacterium]